MKATQLLQAISLMKFDCSALNNVPLAYRLLTEGNTARTPEADTIKKPRMFIPWLQAARMLHVKPRRLPELEAEYGLKRLEFAGSKRSCVVMYLRRDVERIAKQRAQS